MRWLVHWPFMGGLLHLVQREWAWAGCAVRCTKCNSPPINAQCTIIRHGTIITFALNCCLRTCFCFWFGSALKVWHWSRRWRSYNFCSRFQRRQKRDGTELLLLLPVHLSIHHPPVHVSSVNHQCFAAYDWLSCRRRMLAAVLYCADHGPFRVSTTPASFQQYTCIGHFCTFASTLCSEKNTHFCFLA